MSWKQYLLEDHIKIKHGYAFKGEFFSDTPTDDILLTPGNFNIGGGFKSNKFKYYNGEYPNSYILNEGDIIVTMTDLSKEADTLGYSVKVPFIDGKRLLHNQRIGLVQLKTDELNLTFLYWLLRTYNYQKFVANGATGATVKHTSPTKICLYNFTAPTKKETQIRIASILSNYDDLIENNLKRIKLLEEAARIKYLKLLNENPTSLNKSKIKEIGTVITGKTPPTKDADNFGSEVQFIKTPDLHNQIYILQTEQYLSEKGGDLQANKYLPKNSLCISCIGTAGSIGITLEKCQTNQQINSMVFDNPDKLYFYYFEMRDKKELLDAIGSNGATMTNVNKGKFENIELLIPNDELIISYGKEVKPYFEQIINLTKTNIKLKEARDILLPRLMFGEIKV